MNLTFLFNNVFTVQNGNKVVIIFVFGLFSRFFVNYYFDINVFVEFTNIVSLLYYSFMSLFVVLVHELVVFLDVNLFGVLLNLGVYIGKFILLSIRFLFMLVYKFILLLYRSNNSKLFLNDGYVDKNTSVKVVHKNALFKNGDEGNEGNGGWGGELDGKPVYKPLPIRGSRIGGWGGELDGRAVIKPPKIPLIELDAPSNNRNRSHRSRVSENDINPPVRHELDSNPIRHELDSNPIVRHELDSNTLDRNVNSTNRYESSTQNGFYGVQPKVVSDSTTSFFSDSTKLGEIRHLKTIDYREDPRNKKYFDTIRNGENYSNKPLFEGWKDKLKVKFLNDDADYKNRKVKFQDDEYLPRDRRVSTSHRSYSNVVDSSDNRKVYKREEFYITNRAPAALSGLYGRNLYSSRPGGAIKGLYYKDYDKSIKKR